MEAMNIISPSWWMDSKKRIWFIAGVTRNGPNHDGQEVTMIELGKIDYIRRPYAVLEALIKERNFYPL